jgi:hypothetical protein
MVQAGDAGTVKASARVERERNPQAAAAHGRSGGFRIAQSGRRRLARVSSVAAFQNLFKLA